MIKKILFILTIILINLNAAINIKNNNENKNIEEFNNIINKYNDENNKYIILNKINEYFNSFEYNDIKKDIKHIQPIKEFVIRHSGNLEDFVNNKYNVLKEFKAINKDNLYFIYGKKENISSNYITIGYKIKEDFYVLDINEDKLIKLEEYKDFKPIVAYNKLTNDKITININNFQKKINVIKEGERDF